MGLTGFSFELLKKYLKDGDSILELGEQTIYFGDDYGKSAKPMFEKMGHKHTSIDANGQNGSLDYDLSVKHYFDEFDIITDFGTSEHVRESLYNCWWNKHQACKIGGIIVSENPKTGNWAGHGQWYYTQDFYKNFAKALGYGIMELGEHPAMHNTTDGWNIYCVLKKTKNEFITEKEFNKLGIKNG